MASQMKQKKSQKEFSGFRSFILVCGALSFCTAVQTYCKCSTCKTVIPFLRPACSAARVAEQASSSLIMLAVRVRHHEEKKGEEKR